jgi:hypothetical protein
MIAIPAWILFLVFWIVRLFIMLYLAIVVCIVWVFDFIFVFIVQIRDWIYFNIVLPVWNFFMLINFWINFILNIPMMIFELFFRFLFVLQKLIFKFMWDITLYLLGWIMWLVMFIPNLLYEFVLTPIWMAFYWLAG